jgi:hypothetical protein
MNYRSLSRHDKAPTTLTRAELLRSPHREIRLAAAHMRPVVVNGVKYLPALPAAASVAPSSRTLGRSRVNSLPGFEVPSDESLEVARQAVAAQRPAGEPSPMPPHIAALVPRRPKTDETPVLPVRSGSAGSVSSGVYLTLAALLWLAAGAGFAWLALRDAETRIAAPSYDRRLGGVR